VLIAPTPDRDFNGDGYSDFLWTDYAGQIAIWEMASNAPAAAGFVVAPAGATIFDYNDFNGDGRTDLLWQNNSGSYSISYMNGLASMSTEEVPDAGTALLAGTGDFDGDNKADLLWRDGLGNLGIWHHDPNGKFAGMGLLPDPGPRYLVAGTGDFDADGRDDILWRFEDASAPLGIWEMDGSHVKQTAPLEDPGLAYHVIGTSDFNGDFKDDILWGDDWGNAAVWFMDGLQVLQSAFVAGPGGTYVLHDAIGDINGGGRTELVWMDNNSNVVLTEFNADQVYGQMGSVYPGAGATIVQHHFDLI
jgi:hypothetical protein